MTMISITFSGERPRHTARLTLGGACLLLLLAPSAPADAQQRTREISDQEHAWMSRRSGQNRSFEELFGRAQSVGRGEYLGVEPDIGRNIYRFKFMRPGGKVVWVDMDGRTGKVLAERQ